ncbi:MAG TPA: hypothetical protein VFP10_02685 [Candidatus Eisenbacteria bacterium]|nr:hypothetical protein [Candidatus Eisenbacteria bacterium]
MDPQLLHLRVNHLPVVGVFWTLPFILIAALRPGRAALLRAHALIVLLGLTSVIAYRTGEPAEEKVEHLAGVVESAIEAHEDAARWVLGLGIAAGVLGLAGLWAAYSRRLSVARALGWVATLVVVLEMGALIQTATLGGRIHRPELVSPGSGLEQDPD